MAGLEGTLLPLAHGVWPGNIAGTKGYGETDSGKLPGGVHRYDFLLNRKFYESIRFSC